MPSNQCNPFVVSLTLAGVAILAACSSTESHPAVRTAPSAPIEQPRTPANGGPAHSLQLLKDATVANPSDKQSWLKLAGQQLHYRVYGEAMVSALRVLELDPHDKEANSIVALAGLRLSLKALSDRAFETRLPAALRNEAQDLTRQLRTRLAEEPAVVVRRRADSGSAGRSSGGGNAGSSNGGNSTSASTSMGLNASANASTNASANARPATPKLKESDDPFAGLKD